MNKKGQVLNNLQAFIMGIVVLGAMLAIGIFVLAEMQTVTVGTTNGDITTYATTVINVSAGTTYNLTPPNSSVTYTINNITIVTAKNVTFNQTGGAWDLSGSTGIWFARLRGVMNTSIATSSFALYNFSGGVAALIDPSNYTFTQTATDVIKINVTNASFLTDNLSIIFNRTMLTTEDLSSDDYCYTTANCLFKVTANTSDGAPQYYVLYPNSTATGNYLNQSNLGGLNYTVSYTVVTTVPGAGTTTASTATGEMIDKIATAPVWIGLLIVIVFAMAILSYFYMRQE